jgi:hypothetical protein
MKDIIEQITQRIAELREMKKGETMEVKNFINGGIVELEKLRETLVSDSDI